MSKTNYFLLSRVVMKITANGVEHKWDRNEDLSRLPGHVTPLNYKLYFDFQLPDHFSYKGNVEIEVNVSKASSIIWLHSVGLSLGDVCFNEESGVKHKCIEVKTIKKKGVVGLIFLSSISGNGSLHIHFTGNIKRETLNGIYENPFVNEDGDVSTGVCTLFAATEARSGFPCFDEPALKATFDLRVSSHTYLKTVLSNMPVKDTIENISKSEYKVTTFERTPLMSTYLLCIVLGHYDRIKASLGSTLISVYTPLKRKDQGTFPLEVAIKCVEFFSSYFDVPYSLPKLDLIAVSRLSVGAMENWGLITYRESGLLVDQNHTAPSHRQKIASLVSHEISHQWFGNLVTMSWWSDLWLNEGLATFVQYIGVRDLFPDYPALPDQFCVNTSVPALRQDALESSHPIRVSIKESSEISSAFDRITYCKGASVIFMLHNYLGELTFRDGMRLYVKKYSFSNAETEDLWECLSEATGRKINVENIMREWTTLKGYPLVRVSCLESESDSTSIVLNQIPFTSNDAQENEIIWNIPITIHSYSPSNGLDSRSILLDSKEIELKFDSLDLSDQNSFIQINPDFSGFFRTAYSERLSKALSKNISEIQSPVGRLCLIDDRVSMIMADGGSTVRLLEMISSLRETETSFVVWQNICGFFFVLRTFFDDFSKAESDMFDRFCIYIMEPCLEKIKTGGFVSNNHHPDAMLYSTLIGQVGTRGHKKVHEEVSKALKGHLDGTSIIPAALRNSHFKIAASSGCVNLSQMLSLYRDTDLIEEKNRVLYAMGYFKDENVLSQVLDFSLSSEVQPQESLVAICSVCANKHGYRLVWSFFTANFDKFVERYGRGLFLMERLLKAVTESFCTESDLKKVREFFIKKSTSLEGFERNISQAEETIRLNITLKNRDLEGVKDFLYNWHSNIN
ncbi:puromycin-sensitive aminopeptidase [Lepeophtheirus salmonis]|uniref:puromycin-sensitive aminopeptidase n=1 Tax=Lepeophtheirus salmonis TaxID=72036 RepID=UPI001AE1120C|nr:puromycin-sensitive aminopeptidase-like [Lepeophtheirus salmonis]